MRVEESAEGLDGGDDAGDGVGVAERGAHEVAQGAVGDAGQEAEERAVIEKEGPQALGDGEHELPVGDGVEELVLEPVGPDLEALGVAARAEEARLAAEGDQELGATLVATHAGEPVLHDAAVEVLGRSSEAPASDQRTRR